MSNIFCCFHDFSWDFINQILKETYLEECVTVHQNCYAQYPIPRKGLILWICGCFLH